MRCLWALEEHCIWYKVDDPQILRKDAESSRQSLTFGGEPGLCFRATGSTRYFHRSAGHGCRFEVRTGLRARAWSTCPVMRRRRRAATIASRSAAGFGCFPPRKSQEPRIAGNRWLRADSSFVSLPGSRSGSFADSQVEFFGRAGGTKALVADSGKQAGACASCQRPSRYVCRFEGPGSL